MNNNGGLFTNQDLESYKPYIRAPIVAEYRGNKVFTAGPPSGGGITLLTALNILSQYDLSQYQSNSTDTYHLISEAIRRATTTDQAKSEILFFMRCQLINYYQIRERKSFHLP